MEKNKKNTKNSLKEINEKEQEIRHIFLREVDIQRTFHMIQSKEMAKFIGLFAHLAYWLVFGHVNPIEIDNVAKKQIFVQLYEILMFFNSNSKVTIIFFILIFF